MIGYNLPEAVTLNARLNNERTLGQAFAAILNWNTADIKERLMTGDVIPVEQVDEAIVECRKFFMCIAYARAMNLGSVGMMSKVVDEVWHNAILFTSEYFALSAAILGEGKYLHHAPVVQSRVVPVERQNIFGDVYQQLFGRIPEVWGVRYVNQTHVWEDAMQGLCVVDLLQSDCNAVCHPDSCNGGDGQLCSDLPTCNSEESKVFANLECYGGPDPDDD